MSHIQQLVDILNGYQALPHHQSPQLTELLSQVQTWQKHRIKKANQTLFENPQTAPLAHYLIDQIYGNHSFDVLAQQLLTAGNNALNGSGRLEKLIPKNTLIAGIFGVDSAVDAIKLDLALAQTIISNADLLEQFSYHGITDTLMIHTHQITNAKDARTKQIHNIQTVCEQSYHQFNSFLLQKAFALAKSTAYHHGYQPLYDFIGEGLSAIKHIKNITDFTKPFVATELTIIDNIHNKGVIYD